MKLPVYKISIDDSLAEDGQSLGIEQVAFTSKPAIRIKGMAFSSEVKPLVFADKLKYRIAGPIMVPSEIYRNDNDEQYYVQFSAEEIERIHAKFMSDHSLKNVFNLEHNTSETVPAYILEAILVDSQPKINMIHDEYGIDVPMGTSFVVAQITDTDYYNELVKNEQIGFSIEGFLGLSLSEILNNNNTNIQKEEKMNEQTLNLPAGEYTSPNGQCIVVAEDGTFTVYATPADMAMALDVAPSAVKGANPGDSDETDTEDDDTTETKLAATPVAPTTPATPATDDANSDEAADLAEFYSKEEVDAKFDDLYKVIAQMQAEDEAEDADEEITETQPTKLSVHERFAAFAQFARKK